MPPNGLLQMMRVPEPAIRLQSYPFGRAATFVILSAIPSVAVASNYHPLAHGRQAIFLASVLLTCVVAILVAAIMFSQSNSVVLTVVAAGLVLLAGDGLHVVRFFQLPSNGLTIAESNEQFLDPEMSEIWEVVDGGGANIFVRDGRLVIETPPGVPGSVTFPIPPRPVAAQSPRPKWWGMVGLASPFLTEKLCWRARLRLENQFFVVAMIDDLLFQATPYGVHLTVPRADGSLVGHEIRDVSVADRIDHTWCLTRSAGWMELEIDHRVVWRSLDLGPMILVRFGEVFSDELHGGELHISHVDYGLFAAG